jgi:hypothetical protein
VEEVGSLISHHTFSVPIISNKIVASLLEVTATVVKDITSTKEEKPTDQEENMSRIPLNKRDTLHSQHPTIQLDSETLISQVVYCQADLILIPKAIPPTILTLNPVAVLPLA